MTTHWLTPDWPAPAPVRAAITTRSAGGSQSPWQHNNLAYHVGDAPDAVAANRRALREQLGLAIEPQWLTQIHGVRVIAARPDGSARRADGATSDRPGQACVVLTADCLPVLLCDRAGRRVAAVHAGWRGLAKGVVQRAVARFAVPPEQLLAYLGPAISQRHFEVGDEVRRAFLRSVRSDVHRRALEAAFVPAARRAHHFADLYALARAELGALGVGAVYGGDRCTFSEPETFYSYRRDGRTGRFASLIWLAH